MTRKKVKLAFITNDSSRKATFKKRKKGLMKKVNELSILCGISACAIIYSPYDSNPEVWPSKSGVQKVVSEFMTLPEIDQHKKMVDQEGFLRQRIAKATENLMRIRKDNRKLEMTQVMFQWLAENKDTFHFNIKDLNNLGFLTDQYLKDINRRIDNLRSSGIEIGESSNAVVVASEENNDPSNNVINEIGSSSSAGVIGAFFNPFQHRQLMNPHVGFCDQIRNLNLNNNQKQQQWFTEMMNHHPEQMSLPFMNQNCNLQDHQIFGGSSTAPATASSSTPNLTNNMWFR